MSKKKFYAVKRGVVPGIYESWDECSKNVNGYSGSIYKGFETRAEAVEWLGIDDVGDEPKLYTVTDKAWYAVRVGEDPGIYESWEEAKKAIGYYENDAVFRKFYTKEDAVKFMQVDVKSTVVSSDKTPSETFYAVRSGDKPGIYTSWEEAKNTGIGDHDAPVFKKFDNKSDAESFMNDKTIQSMGNGSRKNFYAVRVGDKPGIYTTWEEAKRVGIGDAVSARFKGFFTEEEAKIWLESDDSDKEKKSKKNFYAVRVGINPGIYTTWEEAKKNIGDWRKAKYKGFFTLEEAEEFMKMKDSTSSVDLQSILDNKPYAFVDGSFNKELNAYGFGGFLVENGNRHTIQGGGKDDDMATLWNVGGELSGAIEAIKLALSLQLSEIYIIYDYLGIEMWATGKWKRNKPITEAYHQFVQDMKEMIDIHFVKVKGHTGIEGNEEADKLAKDASGINGKSPWLDEKMVDFNPASELYSYIDDVIKPDDSNTSENDGDE